MKFRIWNLNPVNVALLHYRTSLQDFRLRLTGIRSSPEFADLAEYAAKLKSTAPTLPPESTQCNLEKQELGIVLEPGQVASFDAVVEAKTVGFRLGVIQLATSYEIKRINTRYQIVKRLLNVQPSRLKFEPAFPGQVTNYGRRFVSQSYRSMLLTAVVQWNHHTTSTDVADLPGT